ncbi:MAG: 50S ribosomal protein L10 [Acidobacteriota bacterium]
MPKTRAQKEAQISQIDAVLTGANSLYLVSLSGLSSNDVNKLRATLRKEGARIRVVKNRLARRAATGKPTEQLDSHFRGPTAIVYHPTDPVATAKGLVNFAKDHPLVVIKGGMVEQKQAVDAAGVKFVSSLPGLSEIRATLLALLQAPAGQLVRLLATPGTQVARVISEKAKA